ncbi:hypothetical protein ABTX81_30260 [Kitasatospora sp. NPDC097605]|uniref:hypothetical protein n=1 Tax=Kitasatospora sp. NPDC097605 TaxID=3157226 RepID=UPI0033259080
MHTTTENDTRAALTALAEPAPAAPADDYGHGQEDAKAAVREALTDHPDPEHSLRTWAVHPPTWQGYNHEAGYHHIQYEAAQILASDPDTLADYLTPAGDESP